MADTRPRVLHLGPDVPGGMSAAVRALFASPLAQRYRLEFVPTHSSLNPLGRIAVFGSALLRMAWWSIRGRGRIVHIHSTKRGSMARKAVCVLLAKTLRRRVVLHVHSGPGDLVAFRSLINRFSLAFLTLSFRAADVVLAVSAASARSLEESYGAAGVLVLPNPAPPRPSQSLERASGESPRFAYLGGFANPVKGGAVLLDALAHPEAGELRVVLAGPGELPPEGRRLVDGGAVEWRGWLEQSERDELLREASVFVLASTSEGLPMALMEAMSYELAIVATEVGGVPDLVDDGLEALTVQPGDPAALLAAMRRLDADADLCRRLGRSAGECAHRLDAAEIARRVDAIYRRLL